MIRLSFRQSMLGGFLLIALLLSWAAVRSWLVVEQFAQASRRGGEDALQISGAIQELAERTVDLERSARQFMVLKDTRLIERFDANVEHSLMAVGRLESLPGSALGQLPGDWRQAVEQLRAGLHSALPGADLLPLLKRLAEINGQLAHGASRWIDQQNIGLQTELARKRLQLTGLVVATVVGAFLVALAMGWWLSRPIGGIVRAIEHLGQGHFTMPVTIGGPADLRQVGRRLEWLRQRLGELEGDRERTLRHVSHELKTPLTALREGIALLQEQVPGPLAGAQQEVVDILQHNVMTLQRHIESLLRLNAACCEMRRANLRPLPLRGLLAEVVAGRELQIQARRLTVLCAAPAIAPQLDGEKLPVVLDNLLSNAIDFSPEGGVIHLQADSTDQCIRISCRDQGPGIASEDVERIFEPFAQGRLPPPTPRQGSGVGLSIVRELMSAMGGRVTLVPDDGKTGGAHFRIEVPCGNSFDEGRKG